MRTLENIILYLIGFPGVGKLTIAKILAEKVHFRIIDNHYINNVIFPIVDMKATPLPEEVWISTRKIRDVILETITNVSPKAYSFIFTNVLCEDNAQDRQIFETIRRTAEARDAVFVPVRLHCDPHENARRIVQPGRRERMKMTNSDKPHQIAADETLLKTDHSNLLDLDVTHLSAEAVADVILAHVSKIHNA